MSKKTIILIGFVAVLATAAAFLHAAGPKEPGEGKFHLVYLVAAVDLKPGSKVTVDPVFFTDGRTVKSFHDYCRDDRKKPLAPGQVNTDRRFIENYCSRKTFILNLEGFHTLNNHGQQLTFKPIEFKVVGELEHSITHAKDSVTMGYSQVTSYTPGTVEPPKWLRNDGAPEYFFLMSRDRGILEKIVPVARTTRTEIDTLAKRAVDFSRIAKGRVAPMLINARDIERNKICCAPNPITEFRLENPLVFDLDLDGKPDLLVNVYTVFKIESDPDQPLVADFSAYRIFGNGETVLVGGRFQEPLTPSANLSSVGGAYQRFLRNGYAARSRLIPIRLNEQDRVCVYVLEYSAPTDNPHPAGYLLGSPGCKKSYALQKQRDTALVEGVPASR